MRRHLAIVLFVLAAAGSALTAEAQTPAGELQLRIAKINGFNMGGQIEGRFRLAVSGPTDLQRVAFLIDDRPMGEINAPPFSMTFDTSAYAFGRHILKAVGEASSGVMLESNVLTVEFVTPEAAGRSVLQIVVPILAIVGVASVVSILGPLFGGRHRHRRRSGEYGLAGGAICARCGHPFARHVFTPRLFGVRLERCLDCGKWQFAVRASPEELAQAEAHVRGGGTKVPLALEDDDSLRRMIDDSRFED